MKNEQKKEATQPQIRSINANTWTKLTKEQVSEATKRAVCMYGRQDDIAY